MAKVPNDELLAAGLDLMRQNSLPLTRIPSKGRSMIYATPDGRSVRARTCNDHILIVVASDDSEDAQLNVENTDLLLFVYPSTPRTDGPVEAFLLPVPEVVEAARRTHHEWLATKPRTRGNNRTWNLWFDDDGPAQASGFAKFWAKYRLDGHATTVESEAPLETDTKPPLGDVISACQRQIAEAAGVPVGSVRISVEWSRS